MTLGIVFAMVLLVAILFTLGWPRIHFPRQPSLEGIEDRQAAQAYDRISRWPQFRALRWMIVRKLGEYQPSGALADIGCGPGLLTTLIAQTCPHLRVLGLDTADEMIRTAAANASSLGLSQRVEFRKGDVGSLPLSDASLDFAVSTLSLHHWSDASRGLTEIHRVLKPGGQLLLFDLRRDPRRFFYWLLRFGQAFIVPTALSRINEPVGSVLASYTPAELEGLFARSPFGQCKVQAGLGWVFVWGKKA